MEIIIKESIGRHFDESVRINQWDITTYRRLVSRGPAPIDRGGRISSFSSCSYANDCVILIERMLINDPTVFPGISLHLHHRC